MKNVLLISIFLMDSFVSAVLAAFLKDVIFKRVNPFTKAGAQPTKLIMLTVFAIILGGTAFFLHDKIGLEYSNKLYLAIIGLVFVSVLFSNGD